MTGGEVLGSKRTLTVDGVTLAYEDRGEGRAVVFVHGFPTSTYSWSRVAGPLSECCRTVSFDMMGFGDSDKPLGESYGIPRQAELIWGSIERLGLERPVLVGHSMGGGVCLRMLRDRGADQGRVGGLVLADPSCYPQRLPWFFQALRVPLLPSLVLRRIPPWMAFHMVRGTAYHPRSGMKLEDMTGYILNVHKPGAAEAFVATAKEIVPPDIDEMVAFYPKISVPTLVIWGKQDGVIPLRFGERLAREISNARLHVVDECRHTPQEEHPEETLGAIRRFLEACSGEENR